MRTFRSVETQPGPNRLEETAMLNICLLAILLATSSSSSQSCNPAVVDYIVRDERGAVLSAADLQSVSALLPKTIGDAGVDTSEVSFASDKQTYYWPESVEFQNGSKLSALEFANAATCVLHLGEVTISYHDKKMRLIFNIEISRNQKDRRPIVDSQRFQEGTFQLDLSDWSHESNKLIPADRWKKIN